MPSPLVGFIWGCIMLQKIKNSYFFSNRFFSLCLVFFISFSIFSFGFSTKKVVKANPVVAPVVAEYGFEILVAFLGSVGVTVSVPFAQEFYNDLKENSANSDLPTWKNHGLMDYLPQGVQYVKEKGHEGFVASSDFMNKLVDTWNSYIDNVKDKPKVLDKNLRFIGQSGSFTVPPGEYTIRLLVKNDSRISFGQYIVKTCSSKVSYKAGWDSSFSKNAVMFNLGNGSYPSLNLPENFCGVEIHPGGFYDSETYKPTYTPSYTKPFTDKQNIYLPMPVVNKVSDVVKPQPFEGSEASDFTTTFPVGNTQTGNLTTTPVVGVPKDVAIVGSPSDVGGVPWVDVPSIDKPVDGADSKPVDKPIDKPVDKPVGGIGENIWDKILEFLKKILVPSDNFFIDEFKALEGELNGKFNGNGLNYISDFKNNSKSVDPKFVYTFTIMGTTVTLDFSFVTRIVPLCHIVFGGLTLLFLAWYHYKNVLLLIRGISPVEGGNFTGNSSGGGIDFKSMGDSAPSSPVSTISTSKGNSNYSTTNKYSGGAK